LVTEEEKKNLSKKWNTREILNSCSEEAWSKRAIELVPSKGHRKWTEKARHTLIVLKPKSNTLEDMLAPLKRVKQSVM